MNAEQVLERLECMPIIAAIRDNRWRSALQSPTDVVFYLDANLMTVKDRIAQAHDAGKIIFLHLDLAEGIGKDKAGIEYLADCGLDGIISTRPQIIRMAKDVALLTVQRFFMLDSQGLGSVQETLRNTNPHFMEIMPGVIPKTIRQFSAGPIPVIAGGLIETKGEITAALSSGATAISTGSPVLWEL